jgi:hypothetical protein
VFRRDELVRLRDEEALSWRAIAKKLDIPVMTAVDAYRNPGTCTETVPTGTPVTSKKTRMIRAAV